MEERVWRHRFVESLKTVIQEKTALGLSIAFRLAFGLSDTYWKEMGSYPTPEDAASAAFEELKRT